MSGPRFNARDPDAGRIRLSNTVFANAGAAVLCASTPGRLEVDNCLKIGGALFDLRGWPTGRDLTVSARHLTLRNGESFCRVQLSKTRGRNAQVRAALDESVFDLAGRAGRTPARDEQQVPFGRDIPMVVTGRGSVIRTNVPILAWVDRAAPDRSAIELSSAVVEGLAVGEFQFIGKSSLIGARLGPRWPLAPDSAPLRRAAGHRRRATSLRRRFRPHWKRTATRSTTRGRLPIDARCFLRLVNGPQRDDHFRSRPGMLSATLVPLAGSGLELDQ